MDPMFSNGSHATLMSYTDHSVQSHLKPNEPNCLDPTVRVIYIYIYIYIYICVCVYLFNYKGNK